MEEVIALVQQGLAQAPGQRISKAIPQVQPCRMVAAAPEIAIGRPSDPRLRVVNSGNRDARGFDELIETATDDGVPRAIDDDGGLKVVHGRYRALIRGGNRGR